MSLGRLEQDWAGRTVFLIGGGPSLRGFDFGAVRGRGIVVAINDAMFAAPFADVVFSIDAVWLMNRHHALLGYAERGGHLVAAVPCNPAWPVPGATYVLRRKGAWLSGNPGELFTGDNSGFGALGMALMRGARRVALLGYDMAGPGHFHKGYEWRCRFGEADYPRWASYFPALAVQARDRGVDVVNCNPESAIRCFRFGSWEDVAE